MPIWQQSRANQLGGSEYNFRCLKRFFRKVQRNLRSAFFLKLRFLKIRVFVTWLKCLLKDLILLWSFLKLLTILRSGRNYEGWSLYISRNKFLKFSNISANSNVSIWTYKSCYFPKLFISNLNKLFARARHLHQ